MCKDRLDGVLISIIIPVYNVEQYLEKCLDSVTAQTHKNLDIILVDDGSTDSSGQICDKYEQNDSRIKVLHKKNGGLVSARKEGLHIAKGDYIGFVDSDDYIEENMFEKLLCAVDGAQADFVHSGFYIDKADATSTISNFESKIYDISANRVEFLKKYVLGQTSLWMHPSIWSKLFRAEFIKECYARVPDQQQYGEDLINLVLAVMKAKRIATDAGMYYHYVYRESSIINTNTGKLFREMDLHHCLTDICNQLGISDACKTVLDTRLYGQVAEALSVVCANDELHIPRYYIKDISDLLGKQVVIYGAGDVGIDIYHQLSKYENCDVVGIVDRNYKNIKKKYIKIKPIDELLNMQYDILLVAVKYQSVANSITENLIQMGVSKGKIIWKKTDSLFGK